ncbi:MAG: sigma-54-dependent Fis family transcriptional regulator [Balneolaceae bacterium]|nr:sigma-54-dependent Fis family transcriptional regulator [Balneolaceae bacterium]
MSDFYKPVDLKISGEKMQDQGKPVFITNSPVMLDLYHKIQLIAKTKATVLITGENGTGKEIFAKLLHYHSKKRNKPMITVNCGAIPNELVESELLGHEKGAFTGAISQKMGCFEMADKGTLFLDEIGEMSLNAQVKLLRAVEVGVFRRVGGKQEIKVDVSLISATNKILSDQVKAGSFREDLFYRLNVIELYIPPLRHRKEDILLLAEYYKNVFCKIYELQDISLAEETISIFQNYDWPGNIRELKNTIERCIVLLEGDIITPDMLPASISKVDSKYANEFRNNSNGYMHIPVGTSLDEIERRAIEETLLSVDNNKTEAAKLLGFARKTLHNKLDKYDSENCNLA